MTKNHKPLAKLGGDNEATDHFDATVIYKVCNDGNMVIWLLYYVHHQMYMIVYVYTVYIYICIYRYIFIYISIYIYMYDQ